MDADGLTIIDKAFNQVYRNQDTSFAALLMEIMKYVPDFGKERFGEFKSPKCGLTYSSQDIILLMWSLGLMSLEYSLGMLKIKAKDGHCYNHTKPCPDASDFHQKIIDRCRESIEALILEK